MYVELDIETEHVVVFVNFNNSFYILLLKYKNGYN